jgi:TatD DNase family protein
MRLVDTHCHLESVHFANDLDRIINDALEAGIVKLITSTISPDQWDLSRNIALRYSAVEFALGIHPWYLSESFLADIPSLHGAKELGAVAIGEIGIDSKIKGADFILQMKFFENQLAIAREIDLPVVVHCRGAFNELLHSLRHIGAPKSGGIIHSYSGSIEIARELVRFGMSFSMGGILTFHNSKKRMEVMKYIYPDHFLLETDSPDIPPVQKKGEINYPNYILYNLAAAADILNDTPENVAENTTKNAIRIFHLSV